MEYFLGVLFILVCLLLILVVLLQKGRGGGLGAAFGGAGGSAFGTRTGDVFTWITIVLTAMFLLLAILSSALGRPDRAALEPPKFIPGDTTIREALYVTLRHPVELTEIHYTTDGSEPTEESPTYQKRPVKVSPGTVLKARAYRGGYDPSSVARAFYPAPGQTLEGMTDETAAAGEDGPPALEAPQVDLQPTAPQEPTTRPVTPPIDQPQPEGPLPLNPEAATQPAG